MAPQRVPVIGLSVVRRRGLRPPALQDVTRTSRPTPSSGCDKPVLPPAVCTPRILDSDTSGSALPGGLALGVRLISVAGGVLRSYGGSFMYGMYALLATGLPPLGFALRQVYC